MSIWDRILGNRDVDRSVSAYQQDVAHDRKASHLAFVDIEYSLRDKKIHDIGRALKNYRYFHFIGVFRRHYRAFTRRSGYDV